MKKFIEEYGRIILIIIVVIILILLLRPVGIKVRGVLFKGTSSAGDSTRKIVRYSGRDKLKDDEFYFYVEGEYFIGKRGMPWDEWVASDYNKDKYGKKVFDIYFNPCTQKYRIGKMASYETTEDYADSVYE